MCKKIKKAGCNVVLVQKSILRDAVNELSLHFLSKLKIMVISDIERDQIDFIARVGYLDEIDCFFSMEFSLTNRLLDVDLWPILIASPLISSVMLIWSKKWISKERRLPRLLASPTPERPLPCCCEVLTDL